MRGLAIKAVYTNLVSLLSHFRSERAIFGTRFLESHIRNRSLLWLSIGVGFGI